jgi:hypothetical protein
VRPQLTFLGFVRVEPAGIPTAFWRSVGPSHNVFVVESFIDELAAAAKQDPVAYRLASSRRRRVPKPSSSSRHKRPAGDSPWPKGLAVVFRSSTPSPTTWRISPKSKSRRTARFVSGVSSARLIAALSSIPISSERRFRAGSFSESLRRFTARSRSRTAASSKPTSILIKCCG